MRFLVVAALAAAAGAAVCTAVVDFGAASLPQAEALTAGDLVGAYVVKFKGDGWASRSSAKAGAPTGYQNARIAGTGRIEIVARDASVNDDLVTVRVLLDAPTKAGMLGAATSGTPALEATAAVVGNSISLVGSGQPNYVNAMVLRFDGAGRKVNGNWMAVFPALAADPKFATGVSVTVTGKRSLRDGPGRVR